MDTYPRRMIQPYLNLFICLAVFFPFAVSATCFNGKRADVPQCRYPQGDKWCAENYPSYPFAYNDSCVNEANISPPQPSSINSTNTTNQAAEAEAQRQRIEKYKQVARNTVSIVKGLAGAIASTLRDEPTDAEVAQAVANKMKSELSKNPFAAALVVGMIDASKFKINSIKKLSCKSDGSNAFICDIEVNTTDAMTGNNTNIEKHRFVKGTSGWLITD